MTVCTPNLRFDAETRTRLLILMTLDVDPVGSLVDLQVDGTWHTAEWLDTPVKRGSRWEQTARTVDYFAGPDATPDGATVLSIGPHPTKSRVTLFEDILVAKATTVAVIR